MALLEAETRARVESVCDPLGASAAIERLHLPGNPVEAHLFDSVAGFEVGSLIQIFRPRILQAVARRMAEGEFTRDEAEREDRFAAEVWIGNNGFNVKCVRPWGATARELELEAVLIDQRPTIEPVPGVARVKKAS